MNNFKATDASQLVWVKASQHTVFTEEKQITQNPFYSKGIFFISKQIKNS